MQTILRNLQMYATQAREIISRHHKYGWVLTLFAVAIVLGIYFRKDAINAASFVFTQSSWATGITANTATHTSNQTGWAEYSAGTNITAGATASLTPSNYIFKDDGATTTTSITPGITGGTFSAGTLTSTAIYDIPGAGSSVELSRATVAHPMVSGGLDSEYTLKSDGTVWAWGNNANGQLGDGTTTQRLTPVQVHGTGDVGFLTGVTALASGNGSAYALKSDGTVWAWGNNANGQLGDNTLTQRNTPVQVLGPGGTGFLTGITAVSSRSNSAYALKSDGTVWAWGNNSSGQLGDNTLTQRNTPVQVHGTGDVGFLTGITAITAGNSTGHVLKSDGTVWGWGWNNGGSLGDNTATQRNTPVQVHGAGDVGFLTGVTAITAGSNSTYALKSDGTVWAWGNNGYCQLGDNTACGERYIPAQVHGAGDVGFLTGVTAITAGSVSAYALKSDGTVWAWGDNTYGELGDNTTTQRSTPVQVHGVGDVGFLTGVTTITGGSSSAYALKQDGTIWAWGNNGSGQLGDNTLTQRLTPVQVVDAPVLGYFTATTTTQNIIDGNIFSSYSIKPDGTVWAWGDNTYGQLGDNTTVAKTTPIQIHGLGNVGFLTDVVAVATSDYSAYALKQDGTVLAWGYNSNGQLGDGTITQRLTPVLVSGLTSVISIAGGGYSGYALKSDGTVWAWGSNGSGQLGDGTTTQRLTPVQVHGAGDVGFLTGVTALASGNGSAYALKSDGTVWAWGINTSNELGDNTAVNRLTPVQVVGAGGTGFLTNITALASQWSATYALKSDGTVWAWGYDYYGLGDGVTTNSASPVQVSGLTTATAISTAQGTGYALKSDGTVWAWGYNAYGQLGNNTTTNSSTPVQVLDSGDGSGYLTGINRISAGYQAAYARKTSGALWTWGRNSSGELGDNTTTNRLTPVQVRAYLDPVGMSVGSASYSTPGTFTSAVIDLATTTAVSTLTYGKILNSQTLTLDIRAGNTATPDGTWTAYLTGLASGGDISSLSGNRYFQYRANLSTGNTAVTPSLTDVTINYAATYPTTGDLTSSVYNTEDQTSHISSLSWTETGTTTTETIRFQIRTSPDNITWSAWCGTGDTGYTCAGTNYFTYTDNGVAIASTNPIRSGGNDQYFQYKALFTSAGTATPTLSQVNINYFTNNAPDFDTSFGGGTGITAVQETDGTVTLTYKVRDIDTLSASSTPGFITPSFEYSIDDGTTWGSIYSSDMTVSSTANKVVGETAYTTHTATWNAVKTIVTPLTTTVKVRITANDNEAAHNTITATSGSFTLNTRTNIPSLISFTDDGATSTTSTLAVTGGDFDLGSTASTAVTGSGVGASVILASSGGAFTPKIVGSGLGGASYAIKDDGTVWAWGRNNYGQLGDGTTTNRNTPVQVSGLTSVIDIAAAGDIDGNVGTNYDAAYALKSDGTVWAWGANAYGQLGDGTTTNRLTPVQVTGLTGITQVAAGVGSGYAFKNTTGEVYSWGDNSQGQLGDGTTTQRTTPVLVSGLSGSSVVAVAANLWNGYALKSDGTVWAWGFNSFGGLGVAGGATSIPVQSGVSNIAELSAGAAHMLARDTSGNVWAWGFNSYGGVGNGTTSTVITPVRVISTSDVAHVYGGGFHSLALKTNGQVWAWGANHAGELGVLSHPQTSPVLLSDFTNVTSLAGAYQYSLALHSNGSISALGRNNFGQLGDGTNVNRSTVVEVGPGFNVGGGLSYASSGTFTSNVINLAQLADFTTLAYSRTYNSNQTITVDARAGNTATPGASWTAWQTDIASGGSITGLSGRQYFQYRVTLTTTNTTQTPSLDKITIFYTPFTEPTTTTTPEPPATGSSAGTVTPSGELRNPPAPAPAPETPAPTPAVSESPSPVTTPAPEEPAPTSAEPAPDTPSASSEPTSEVQGAESSPVSSPDSQAGGGPSAPSPVGTTASSLVPTFTAFLTDPLVKGIEQITALPPIKKTIDVTTRVVEDPVGAVVTKVAATAGVVSGTAVAVTSLFLNPLSLAELFLIPARIMGIVLSGLGIRRRARRWGTVYDSVTKQPLDPAYVILKDAQGNDVATSITDLDGRYGFLIGTGTYTIVANKTNYTFPSKKLAGKTRDILYDDLYFGEELTLASDSAVITKNIPLDPETFDWNEFVKKDQKLMKFHTKNTLMFQTIATYSLFIGLPIALIGYLVTPAPYNTIIAGLYIVLFILRMLGLKPKSHGSLTDTDGTPLSYAIVRVHDVNQGGKEIFHRVADAQGRYYCLVQKGQYTITVEKKNPDESYTLVYTSPVINAEKGVINQNVRM